MSSLTSLLKSLTLSFSLLISLLFFLYSSSTITPNNNNKFPLSLSRRLVSKPNPSNSSYLQRPPSKNPSSCPNKEKFTYTYIHSCLFSRNTLLSVPTLSIVLVFHFYFLVKTAQDRFSVVVTKLSTHLQLSPTTGAVTLLALGNGAPDVFASVAAVRSGHARTGLGAILSAGTFVSALVVGLVSLYSAPFSVDPAPFVRDVFFYLVSSLALFYVYLSAEIFLWQAISFVAFYAFFVALVFYMDVFLARLTPSSAFAGSRAKLDSDDHHQVELNLIKDFGAVAVMGSEIEMGLKGLETEESDFDIYGLFGKISRLWEVPVLTLLKLTIPSTSPSEWSRFYRSANFCLCPILLLYSCRSFISLNHRIIFFLPHTLLPLWSVVLFVSFSLGLLHYIFEKDPPQAENILPTIVAFVMSVFWISTVAGELLDCLAAVGAILKLPPSILGMTVLAWGNSVGDLVADVAVAKAGQPAMAMAGCFAGPMFNMLVGLGSALVIQTADAYPKAYELQFNLGIVIAFVFLFLSLMGSLLVVTWSRFRVPRFWGFCLVGLYALFIVVSLIIAKTSA